MRRKWFHCLARIIYSWPSEIAFHSVIGQLMSGILFVAIEVWFSMSFKELNNVVFEQAATFLFISHRFAVDKLMKWARYLNWKNVCLFPLCSYKTTSCGSQQVHEMNLICDLGTSIFLSFPSVVTETTFCEFWANFIIWLTITFGSSLFIVLLTGTI